MDHAALRANDERLLEALRLEEGGVPAAVIAEQLGCYESPASVKTAVAAVRRDLRKSEGGAA